MSIITAIYEDNLISINEYHRKMTGKIQCKLCKSTLIAKKGEKVIHHFAHKSNYDCDSWYYRENKSQWHFTWQNICKKEHIEKIITKNGIKHIADIYNPGTKSVIEIQNSYLNKYKINDREKFYDNLIWIINLTDSKDYETVFTNGCFVCIKIVNKKKDYVQYMNKQIYFDTRNGICKVIKHIRKDYYICDVIPYQDFLSQYFLDILKKSTNETIKTISHGATYLDFVKLDTKDIEYRIKTEYGIDTIIIFSFVFFLFIILFVR